MKYFTWEEGTNRRLQAERGVGFEDIVSYVERCPTIDIARIHHGRHDAQRLFIMTRRHYTYLVPFVEDDASVFLQTIITRHSMPSVGRTPGFIKLDSEEQKIHDSFDDLASRAERITKQEWHRYTRYARATFRKDRRLNIRMSSRDLEVIQKRARAAGLPYQTLIASLLHKFAAGRLNEET